MKASGLQLNYYLSGALRQPLVLFLHGFMGSGVDWEAVIAALSNRFCCLTVDLPGHGGSAAQNRLLPWTMETAAAGVVAVLKHLGVGSAFLVGYSMGGRLALYLAVHYGKYFPKAVLESASPGLRTASERTQRIRQDVALAARLERENFSAFLEDWYRQPLFKSLHGCPGFAEMRQRRLNNDPLSLAKSLREMGTGRQPALWEALRRIKIPLLLLVGGNDIKFNGLAVEMLKRCASARIASVPGCGHNVHFEKPEIFAELLKNYFDH